MIGETEVGASAAGLDLLLRGDAQALARPDAAALLAAHFRPVPQLAAVIRERGSEGDKLAIGTVIKYSWRTGTIGISSPARLAT